MVDGDTTEISRAVGGNEEVRLIGMDTPETKDPSKGLEPLGPEASAIATDELTNQNVGLEFDVEREAPVWVSAGLRPPGREDVQFGLVEEGYAHAHPYEPNTRCTRTLRGGAGGVRAPRAEAA